MNQKEKICLGVIIGAHGIRGEVKVRSFSENAKGLDKYGPLEDKSGSKKFVLKVTGLAQGDLRVKINGVEDRNAAEALKGTELYVEHEALPKLDADEFYHSDLIGLDVIEKNSGNKIGKVDAMYNFGASDIVEICLNSGKLEMLPFTKQYVPEVNIKDGCIIVEEMTFAPDEEGKNEG